MLLRELAAVREDAEPERRAVQQNGMALQFASEALRGDVETVRLAVWQIGPALLIAAEALGGGARPTRCDAARVVCSQAALIWRVAMRGLRARVGLRDDA